MFGAITHVPEVGYDFVFQFRRLLWHITKSHMCLNGAFGLFRYIQAYAMFVNTMRVVFRIFHRFHS